MCNFYLSESEGTSVKADPSRNLHVAGTVSNQETTSLDAPRRCRPFADLAKADGERGCQRNCSCLPYTLPFRPGLSVCVYAVSRSASIDCSMHLYTPLSLPSRQHIDLVLPRERQDWVHPPLSPCTFFQVVSYQGPPQKKKQNKKKTTTKNKNKKTKTNEQNKAKTTTNKQTNKQQQQQQQTKKKKKTHTKKQKLVLQWIPYQAPDVIGSALGMVGPMSVYCDWVRQQVRSATPVSWWQHVQLPEQIYL